MNARPLVLLTDYGATDFYAGVTRAVIAAASPASRVIDLQHDLPAHDIAAASFVLARALRYLPDDAVVVVVVDPGVGTARRGLIATVDGRVIVGPDNGTLSDLIVARGGDAPGMTFVAIDNEMAARETRVRAEGATFHGRDIFAPVAAAIARGAPLLSLGVEVGGITMLRDVPSVSIDGDRVHGTGRYVDRFGNLLTDIPRAVVERALGRIERVVVSAGDQDLGPLRETYAGGTRGRPIALINSWDLVEAAVNGGRAIDCFAGASPRSVRFELRAR